MVKRVVLAYSGGLDTSVLVRYLKEKGFEVITYTANVGQREDLSKIPEKAKLSGAVESVVEDLREEFAREYCLPTLRALALYEGKYPLSASLSRPLIAKRLVYWAERFKAKYVAHGSTGKGNDQVRFELSVWALNPDLEVLAPVREWEFKSREEEVEYAKKFKIPVKVTKEKPYSIDENLWGVSIECGPLEDLTKEPPRDTYLITVPPEEAGEGEEVELEFEEGTPVALNGKRYKLLHELVEELNRVGGRNAIGRIDLLEDRLVGIKSREIYESPGAIILYKALEELYHMVLDRFSLDYFLRNVPLEYAKLVYEGLWFSPIREALDKLTGELCKRATGKVKLKLYKGNLKVLSRSSPYSLYEEELATYGEGDSFEHLAGKYFTKVFGLPLKVLGKRRVEG